MDSGLFLPSSMTGYARSQGESKYPEFWEGLVGYWDFSVQGVIPLLGRTLDLSGKGSHGTLVGGTHSIASGLYGRPLYFDGAGDYIDMGDVTLNLGATNKLSVVSWVRRDANPETNMRVVQRGQFGRPFHLRTQDSGGPIGAAFQVRATGGNVTIGPTGFPIALGQWAQYVGTFDGTTMALYINGVLDSTGANSGTLDMTDEGGLLIGARPNVFDYNHLGAIDYVAIWNRGLSANEVIFLHGHPKALVTPRTSVSVSVVGVDVTVEPATLALTSTLSVPTVSGTAVVTPTTLALALTQQAPTTVISSSVLPTTLALATTLQTLTTTISSSVLPATLTLALALPAPTVFASAIAIPATLTLALTLSTPTTVFSSSVAPVAFALEVDIPPPVIFAGVLITPDTFALALTQQTPSLLIDSAILPTTLGLALAQQAPAVVIPYTVTPDVLTLVLTQHAPTVFASAIVTPDTFTLALTLQSSTLGITSIVSPDTFALAIALLAPTIDVGSFVTITPSVLALALTLQTPRAITPWVDIPPIMHKDIIDPYSGGAWLWLCEIAVSGQDTQRIARNTEDVVYGFTTYDKFNLDIGQQAFSGDGSIPRITLRVFQDVNHVIEDIVNATEGALGAAVKLIRVNEKFLDTPVAALEANYSNLASQSDSEWITFTLGIPNPLTQRIPLRSFSSSVCPWTSPTLFKGPECQYAGVDTSCTGTYDDCKTNKSNEVHWGGKLGLDPNTLRL